MRGNVLAQQANVSFSRGTFSSGLKTRGAVDSGFVLHTCGRIQGYGREYRSFGKEQLSGCVVLVVNHLLSGAHRCP